MYLFSCPQDSFEIQKDSIKLNEKVLLVDDLLATGGKAIGD